jgi:PAS domain S-box-containing protein
MPIALNLMIVEDSAEDAALLVAALRLSGFEPNATRVQTETDYLASLEAHPDLILADFRLPQFSGLRAVDLLRERGLDIPFILVSGTVGEEQAVEAMRRGATDYLLKDRLGRLGKAVEGALEQRRLRQEREQAQQQLALQATALETAANGILITDRTGTILWVNAAFTTMTGYAAADVVGKTPRVLKSGQHDEQFYQDFWQTITGGKTWRGHFINRRKDGSIYYDEHTVTPVRSQAGKITHFIGVMNDVTARRRAEDDLRATHAQLRQLLEHSPAVIYALKVEGQNVRPQVISENITQLLGFTVAEALSYEWWVGQLHPQDRDRAIASVSETLTRGTSRIEYRIRHKNDNYHWVEDNRRVVYDLLNKPSEIAGVWTDITERKQAEGALQRLAYIVESSNDAIIGESLDGQVTSWNPAAERIFGYCAAEMIGQPVATLLPPDRVGEQPAILDRIGRGEGTIYLETRRLRKDGVQIDVAVTISPIKDTEGKIVGASKIGRDITLQKRQAAELEEVQKQLRETAVRIGRAEMARTVVHNIGNVLNGIGVSTTLIAQKVHNSKGSNIGKLAALLQQHEADLPTFLSTDPKGKKVPAFVAELAEKFADEQKALTAELQLVGEKVAHIRSIIDTHQTSASVSGLTEQVAAAELVEAALRINAASLESRGVRVIREFSETPPITTEKHKVLQILVNLISNASQALEQGRQTDRQLTFQISLGIAQSILIAVGDNGMGIAPENLPRIFQQGFTTRQGGHGLGLHGSALLARELGGDLTVTSGGPGQGAVFTLELPIQSASGAPRI